jgi:hypothetical protein
MGSDPIEERLREIKETAAADADLEASIERQLHQLALDFAAKMGARSAAPFLSRDAAASGADPVFARGWPIAGVYAEVRFPAQPAPVALVPSGWYDSTRFEGIGVCVDGTVAFLHLDSPNYGGMAPYLQDAYALSHAPGGSITCEQLYSFGLGTDPETALDQLTSALAATLHLHEGTEQLYSDRRTTEASSLLGRVERAEDWSRWASRVEANLGCVDSPVERTVRLLRCLDRVENSTPRPWLEVFQELVSPPRPPEAFDLMENPPWDHGSVLEWFLEAVSVPPAEFTFRHYAEGGWLRGSRWKETRVPGWLLRAGGTERQDGSGSASWRPIVVTIDGEIRGWQGEELAADTGFNARALQQMADLASLRPLPSPPGLRTVSFTDRYGYTSWKYADGAEFLPEVDFVRLGKTHDDST